MTKLPLNSIRRDGGTQSRASLSEPTIAEYVELLESGVDFHEAVTVFYDGTDHWLADGFHRCAAYERYGADKVEAEVRQGSLRDAILHSVGANASHGLRRTNADKRRAVVMLLEDDQWRKRSDRWIAGKCGVHPSFVAKQRAGLSTVDTPTTRLGQDGVERTVPKQRPRNEAPAVEVEEPERHGEEPATSEEWPGDPEYPIDWDRAVTPDAAGDYVEEPECAIPDEPAKPPPANYLVQSIRTMWRQLNGDERAALLSEFGAVSVAKIESIIGERNALADCNTARMFVSYSGTEGGKILNLALEGGDVALALLGLGWSSTAVDATRSFRELSKTLHPDRGGNVESFQALNRAYQLVKQWHERKQSAA